ncbi:component of SufBCD complex [Shimia ponticola]|uniref:component of SufBCD complex n=1 Tax=Shimia ponticola TaxID=2582893 RepID=UPI0011BFB8EA|nr:component of SufBCD complex [Shimia ponticola]
MDFYTTIFEVIDMRSFSNLWYWIALAVLWSSAAHWTLGVPYDMIQRARRKGAEAQHDLEDITRINVKRLLMISSVAGLLILGFAMFLLTTLGLLAFYYSVEFAQALFLMVLPMSLVGALSVSAAQKINERNIQGHELIRVLLRHRFWIQVIGVFAIFFTALWGMYQNLRLGVL